VAVGSGGLERGRRLGAAPYSVWGKRPACQASLNRGAPENDPHSEPAVRCSIAEGDR